MTTERAGDVDLVRHGSVLQMVIGLVDATQTVAGVAYATSTGGPWTVTDLDTGQDTQPRIAVDAAGHAHVSYLRAWPEHEVRYATNASEHLGDPVVETGFIWTQPAFAVDASGVHHVAVGDTAISPASGTAPTRAVTGHSSGCRSTSPMGRSRWSCPGRHRVDRLCRVFDDTSTPLPDRAVRVITGKPGSWTTTRIADDTGGASPSIARDAAGHLHLAYATSTGGPDHIAYATNATGSWVIRAATPGAISESDRNPSIAVDGSGKVHIAFERDQPGEGVFPYGALSIALRDEPDGRLDVDIRVVGQRVPLRALAGHGSRGHPRIAFWLDSGGGSHGSLTGIQVASFDGTSRAATTVSTSPSTSGRRSRSTRRAPATCCTRAASGTRSARSRCARRHPACVTGRARRASGRRDG